MHCLDLLAFSLWNNLEGVEVDYILEGNFSSISPAILTIAHFSKKKVVFAAKN